MGEKVTLTDEAWKAKLDPARYHVLREAGTERAFTGAFWKEKRQGLYVCGACGAPLFDASTKFESGTGWPSFTAPVQQGRVDAHTDESHGMTRTEVRCARCGGHLGHVFDDGPSPTGLRHCINSASLDFIPNASESPGKALNGI
ncbi:MAG: peptide-methionine (R)-S-oxide reductase MsrB [bacterium]